MNLARQQEAALDFPLRVGVTGDPTIQTAANPMFEPNLVSSCANGRVDVRFSKVSLWIDHLTALKSGKQVPFFGVDCGKPS